MLLSPLLACKTDRLLRDCGHDAPLARRLTEVGVAVEQFFFSIILNYSQVVSSTLLPDFERAAP